MILLAVAAGPLRAARHPELVEVESTLCAECHEDKLAGSMAHAPAEEDCTTCHEITISEEATTVVLMDTGPALCLLCHDDKEDAVELNLATPHMPASDSCLTCHDPHSGAEPAVLIGPTLELCAECHDLVDLGESHGGQLLPKTDCATCHDPHGSENPRMLAASRLHAPFEGGSCDACHRAPFGERIRLRVRGERLCAACHGELAKDTPSSGSVHAALQGTRGRAGCLSCHDPHMSDNRSLLKHRGPTLCSSCHDRVAEAATAKTGHAPAADDCLNCHQPHVSNQPRLLSEPRGQLCGVCHDLEPPPKRAPPTDLDIAGAAQGNYGPSTVVRAGDHDNGTAQPSLCAAPFPPDTWNGEIVICERGAVLRILKSKNIRAGGAGGLILVNRADGPTGVFADAHSLPAIHLESAAAAPLASWLSKAGDHRGRIESGRLVLSAPEVPAPAEGELAAAHLGADLQSLDCASCHSPHGAGHPSLLAENLHAPVEDGCDTCHDGRFDQLIESGSELCLFCHDGILEAAQNAPVPHEALELGECTDCHNPHASAQPKLVKAPGAGPCADCHDEQTPAEGEVAHAAIDLVGCRACHEAHGGANEKLLRQTGPGLCLSCHSPGAAVIAEDGRGATLANRFDVTVTSANAVRPVILSPDGQRDHPVTGHRTIGQATEDEIRDARVETDFTGELTCLACHDPHKGRSAKLFRWNATSVSEACAACHTK